MTKIYEAKLSINKKEVEMNPFVESFVARVTVGVASSLKGVDYISNIELKQNNRDVSVTVNGEDIPLTPFPNDAIANTFEGLVKSLKGVEEVKTLDIKVNVKQK